MFPVSVKFNYNARVRPKRGLVQIVRKRKEVFYSVTDKFDIFEYFPTPGTDLAFIITSFMYDLGFEFNL